MKFQVQQKVKVIRVFEEDTVDVGDILVVAGVVDHRPDEQPYRCVPIEEWQDTHPIDRRTDAGAWYSEDQLKLHVPGYVVGTEVEITNQTERHTLDIGSRVEVASEPKELLSGKWYQRVVQYNGPLAQKTWWVSLSDMSPVTSPDMKAFVEEAKEKGEPGVFTKALEQGEEVKKALVTGGPSSYYDMPFSSWVTVNDMMEYLAEHKWGKYGIHLKDIFKGCCRWGEKSGTSVLYDTRKIIYYGLRILRMVGGNKLVQEYLQELSNDPQFKDTQE